MLCRLCSRVAVALSVASSTAWAGSFLVSYEAPASCPDRAAFVRGVEERVPDWRVVDAGGERAVSVRIRTTDAGFSGSVALDGAPSAREVDGVQCESVVRALALVAAVGLDPNAVLGGVAEPPPPPTSPPPSAAPSPLAHPTPAPAEPHDSASPALSGGFGAGAAAMLGPAPSALYGVEVHAWIGSAEGRFLARALGARLVTGSVAVGSGHARFELTHGELGLCYRPLRGTVRVTACAVTDLGQIQAAGESGGELVQGKTSKRLWGASGARLGAGYALLGPLEVGANAGLLVPWKKQGYFFEDPVSPDENLYESAPLAIDFRLGATVIFP